jgi:trimeric autotransporter adhesin
MKKLIVARAALAAGASIAALSFCTPAWAGPNPECVNGPSGNSTECGKDSSTIGASSTAVGADAEVTAASGTAIGFDTLAAGQALAVGARAEAAINGTAIGASATAATNAVALGRLANAATNAVALGGSADAQGEDSIALGANSFTDVTEANVVSIGSSLAGSEFQRRLINLALVLRPPTQ